MRNPWVAFVVHAYWSMRLPQLARLESVAIGHETDEHDFYDRHEPRVTFGDTLVHCSTEWQAMKSGSLA
jgi:hypothetical protein